MSEEQREAIAAALQPEESMSSFLRDYGLREAARRTAAKQAKQVRK